MLEIAVALLVSAQEEWTLMFAAIVWQGDNDAH
jgi:hypothetical protein